MRCRLIRVAATVLAAAAVGVPGVAIAEPGAALTEPRAALERALSCRGDLAGAGRSVVLLVHGTGSNPEESFSFGYAHALPRRGFPVCTVELPERGLGEMQRAMEYVVFAIREAHRLSGRKVSLLGHSQGAALAAHAPSFWPDLREMVDDVIGLAGPYGGTQTADNRCAQGACPVFAWQLRIASRLSAAFGKRARPAGPSFTAVATSVDELVTPAPEAARLDGARNVVLQDVCPARPVDHYLLVGDAVSYALAVDALTHPGPADPARLDPLTCLRTVIPGADLVRLAMVLPLALANPVLRVAAAPDVDREPALRCPFDAAECPATAPRLHLTRRCSRGGRLRIALAGDTHAVRDVAFKIGRRAVRRDARAPFAATLRARVLRRAGRARLRAITSLDSPAGGRIVLSRPLPRCRA